MDKVSSILKWQTDRKVHELESDKLSDDAYFYMILFFLLFTVIMIGLYVVIICLGFYKSVTDTSRKVEREDSAEYTYIEEV